MPEQQAPERVDRFDLDRGKFLDPKKPLTEPQALALAMRSYETWSGYRQSSQDPKWEEALDLYLGKVTRKFWDEAQKYPRSSIPVRIVYDHCATAASKITTALFRAEPYWFDVVDSDDPVGANAIRQVLSYYLEKPDQNNMTSVAHMKEAIGQYFVPMGTAMGQVGWDPLNEMPFLRCLDPRKVFISPATRVTAETSPGWILIEEMTVGEIKALDPKVFNIPSDKELYSLAQNKQYSVATTILDSAQATEGILNSSSWMEPNPWDQTIQVIVYESKDWVIWVLNGEYVLYNAKNPYGMTTLVMANYENSATSAYGEGIGSLIGAEQKLQQAITNVWIDEVSLNINPVRTRSNSLSSKVKDLVWRPGLEIPAMDATKDFQIHQVGDNTGGAMNIIGMSQQRSYARTGMNAMQQSGAPSRSNADRTAGGVNAQIAASSERLVKPVENFQDFFVVPALSKCLKIIDIMKPGMFGSPLSEKKIKLFGADRVTSRERLAQMVPTLFSIAMNSDIVGKLQQQGETVDVKELVRLLQDASGITEKYAIFRKLSPEELAQIQQAQQQEAEMQQKMMELAAKKEIAASNNQTRLQAEQMKAEAEMNKTGEESAAKIALEMLKAKGGPKADEKK